MKKVSIFMAIAAAASLASCTAQAPKANLKTDIDSLSYSIGMAQTQGLKGYLTGRLDVDTAYMAEFIKGLNEGANKTSKKDIAYMAGLQIGQQISNQMMKGINQELFAGDSTKTISKDNFMAGFIAGTLEKGGVMTMEAAQEYTRTAMETIKAKAMEEKYADNKAAGEKFLAENKTKEGVKTTESGLQYKVITEGKGEIPADTCKVKVNYKGTLIDGTEFDSSYKRNEPATFRANQVIKGWTEALTMMPVGSKWELYIPQELAYGSRESGQIKPFSTLIFEVELVGIEKDKNGCPAVLPAQPQGPQGCMAALSQAGAPGRSGQLHRAVRDCRPESAVHGWLHQGHCPGDGPVDRRASGLILTRRSKSVIIIGRKTAYRA